MKPNPNLIPRFNLDFGLNDFSYSIKSIFNNRTSDQNILSSTFGAKNFFFTNYARSSLFLILKSLNIPQKSKIGVPLYSCKVVFDAIINAGFVPKFIDIDDNYTIDPNDLQIKINDIEAIIVIHTFGRPADMDSIKKVAGDKPIIEDCAHSILSEYRDKKTGTIGDISYFSLAKYISIGGGGMIIINNENMIDATRSNIKTLKKPDLSDELMDTFISYMRSFFYHKPWFGLFALPVGLSIEDKIDLMNKRNFETTAINKCDLNLMLSKLEVFRNKVELQRMNSFFLIRELESTSITLPYENESTYCNYYLFPILFKNKSERDKISEYLRKRGIDSSKLFSKSPEMARRYYGYKDDCKNTERIADRILTVPNYYTLKKNELNKIASLLKSCPLIA